ncbi:NAD(P)-dependent dehydrogenase (short-subunit alcohol dehydrogenase family) [Saccharothrix ecbatanensis]|uniref:NAD(P)-dependent dehydrogenase (Short-subunit alcohol dehydrogenase family) n=1 Tax=Saccharothrix ecbatanensis TaxID=1105145 RepID=A0A7W9HIP8_9PSEU|nr:short chain dehydrogenase [Saccharothrix ecbatanensis]MBB5802865.1 NAD(P)-dependent dehydrogenase (short-subunit alcohol dehydrogenase family) [Saccharothrix ecbatanensis]
MQIVLIGAGGTLGSAVHTTLIGRGHEVVTVGRSSGDLRLDIADPARIAEMYERIGSVDAVVSAAGDTPWKPITEMTPQDYEAAFRGKVLSQVELVRQGLRRVAERGSFTLITGVLAREPVPTGSAASMANGAVEAFVRAAAIEIAPQRVNAVSPTVFTESLDDYGAFFPGMEPVDLANVTQAYVRSVEGAQTGQVYCL